ncbi:DUF3096 domain-containing protein [Candidatus Pacearchaeota archaeon]|nr:DUF3096 domain-containing protein [Candidatus Pacearchaeota archaeon]
MVSVTLTISAILAVIFGLIILVWPKFLNIFVGLYLLITGMLQILNLYY